MRSPFWSGVGLSPVVDLIVLVFSASCLAGLGIYELSRRVRMHRAAAGTRRS